MSYPVKIGNAEVVVASLDEAVELIGKYNRFAAQPVEPANSNNGHARPAVEDADLASFVASLSEGPQQGLRLILQNGGIGANALCAEMRLANNMALTGRVLTPLTRRAHTAGIDATRLIATERLRTADGRTETTYRIPAESVEAVRRGLRM